MPRAKREKANLRELGSISLFMRDVSVSPTICTNVLFACSLLLSFSSMRNGEGLAKSRKLVAVCHTEMGTTSISGLNQKERRHG